MNSIRFPSVSAPKKVTPVRLPPGRLRLCTSPPAIGSVPLLKTIGIVVVAAFAAIAVAGPPSVAMTATFFATSSAASAGSRSS